MALVAVFAMGAIASASASAQTSLPLFTTGKCITAVPPGTGLYSNSTCTTLQGMHAGNFELEAVATGTKYTSKSGVATLEGVSGSKIVCKKSTDKGEISCYKTDKDTVTFMECEEPVHAVSCQNHGAAAGVIETSELETELGYINKAKKEVGVSFKGLGPEHNAHGKTSAAFECGGGGLGPNTIYVTGSVIGQITPVNVLTKEFTLTLETIVPGKQKIEKFETGAKDTLTTETCEKVGEPTEKCASEGSSEKLTATLTFVPKVEVRA
jgi:hypothetical protein